jgi:hypothetical protein
MEDPKETLRKILCDDEELNDAVEILEKLIELDDRKVANWHSESVVIDHDSEYQAYHLKNLLRKFHDGGLVNRALFGHEPAYAITKKGKELYNEYNKGA